MKKLFALLTVVLCILFSGCDEETEFELTVTDITANHSYRYVYAEDCGGGCLYKSSGALWYYDYAHRMKTSLCTKPLCRHEKEPCFAYRTERVYGYKDKFLAVWNDFSKDAEELVFELADIPSQTIGEVLRLENRCWCDTLAYGDKLFIGIKEGYYVDGEDTNSNPDHCRVYLMVVSLETAEMEMLSDCLADGRGADLIPVGIENGKFIFCTRYYEESENGSISDTPVQKYMTCDIETKEIAEFTGRLADIYLDGCAVYHDGDTVAFDREGRISRLDMGFEFRNIPFDVFFYNDGKAYFRIVGKYFRTAGKDDMIYKFDTDTEKMYIASFPDISDMRFITEKEKEFILVSEYDDSKIVTLSKDSQLVFTELDGERKTALFEELFKNEKTPEEIEEENKKAEEDFQKYIDSLLENTSRSYMTPITPPLY